jgi:hypothetical protein
MMKVMDVIEDFLKMMGWKDIKTESSILNFFINMAAYTKLLTVTTHSGSFDAPSSVLTPV